MRIHRVSEFHADFKQVVGVDIETTSRYGGKISDPFRDDMLSISVSDGEQSWVCTEPSGFKSINGLLERPDIKKVIHNANFELQFFMHQLGTKPNKDSIYDSLLAERVINTGKPIWVKNSLDETAARRCGVMLDKTTRESFKNHHGEFSAEQIRYMADDVVYLPAIHESQMADISKMRLGKVVKLENRLTLPVAEMTLAGVCFDQELLDQYKAQIDPQLQQSMRKIADYLGFSRQLSMFDDNITISMNLNSNDQIKALLKRLDIQVENTQEPTLVDFMQTHPNHQHNSFLEMLLHGWRLWSKMDSVDYAKYINPVTGKIHPSWNQIEADTGRFSCSGPNLQNVHAPVEGRPNFRMLFPPPPGYSYIVADYSQQEPRILAQLSEDEAFRRACRETDVYLALSEIIYGEKITKKDPRRQLIKTCVLAFFYGSSVEGLHKRTGIPTKDLEELQKVIHTRFPRAKGYSTRQKTFASQHGYVRTLLGRTRLFEGEHHMGASEGRKARIAVNTPVQGSGADMLKLGLDIFHDVQVERGYDAWTAMQIHDELVVCARDEEADEAYYQVIGALEKAGADLCPDVKIIASGTIAKYWVKD